ncbi:L-type lectin-domain containing receptor kinase IX.1-like [Hevea brasiliensis]|uniref:L-type lectin-domain containing receptor kinase IX.1-like n=1 Tax=Hevea brasiliensis TaxID=3981 RepID=UPI0025F8B544|nr:L-type lectin-domain containing receptor kinase IX.1-like [Hevea brasiliensis]
MTREFQRRTLLSFRSKPQSQHKSNAYDRTTTTVFLNQFYTFKNTWDPPYDHVGVDVNSMKSVKNVKWWRNITGVELNEAWISYSSSTKISSVVFTGIVDDGTVEKYFDSALDLRLYLPQRVIFGFTGASSGTVTHTTYSWNFTSSLENDNIVPSLYPPHSRLLAAVCSGSGLVSVSFIIGFLWLCRDKGKEKVKEDESFTAQLTEQEFETATGAKMMSSSEMVSATNNFDEKNKLGEGGFSAVYKGFLKSKYIAVKKFKRVSIHGLKYYASEVMITGKLKLENLIKLIGWNNVAKTGERVSNCLASALHYMHRGCERCGLHRDIKSSNVLLDSNFNAKLADFGLSRLVSHDAKSLEGWTNGYGAPECHQTGKSSKMYDVYSFVVVAVEISCGRRAFVQIDDGNHVRLVKWVWDYYEQGNLLMQLTKDYAENLLRIK